MAVVPERPPSLACVAPSDPGMSSRTSSGHLHHLRFSPQLVLLVGSFRSRDDYMTYHQPLRERFIEAATRVDEEHGDVLVPLVENWFKQSRELIRRYDKWRWYHAQRGDPTELYHYLVSVVIREELKLKIAKMPPGTMLLEVINTEKSWPDFEERSFSDFMELHLHAQDFHSELHEDGCQTVAFSNTVYAVALRIMDERLSNQDYMEAIPPLPECHLLEAVWVGMRGEVFDYCSGDTLWECRHQGPPEVYETDDPPPTLPTLFSLPWTSTHPDSDDADPLVLLQPLLDRAHRIDTVEKKTRTTPTRR